MRSKKYLEKWLLLPDWTYDYLIVIGLFVISLSLRLYEYNKLPIYNDELIYSGFAFNTLAHGWIWQPENMVEPPLFPYLIAIVTYLFEGSFEYLRLIPILFGSLTVIVIYFLGKILYGRGAGFLSALFLSFSSYHILYSKILMMEALVIFFIFSSLYFFWKSFENNELKSAYFSGILLGLALNTKWIALLVYPSLTLFLLWTKRKVGILLEKRIIIIYALSFLMLIPTLAILYKNSINLYDIFFKKEFTFVHDVPTLSYGSNLISRSFNKYLEVFIDDLSPVTLSLPWLQVYRFSASLLIIATILFYIYFSLKGNKKDSFLMAIFGTFNLFVFFYIRKSPYYLLWALPAFLIMISNLILNSFNKLKMLYFNEKLKLSLIDITKIAILFIAIVFTVSYIQVGIFAPSKNMGDKSGFKTQVSAINNRILPGESVASDRVEMIRYYFYQPEFYPVGQKIHIIPDIYLIRDNPRFLILKKFSFDRKASSSDKKMIYEKYNLISNENGILLYERKPES
jgi:4-amino-4-deoxy-L-arabinose transferase-like glycosyltransferase